MLVTGYNPSNINSPEVRHFSFLLLDRRFIFILFQEMQHESVVLEKSWADMDSN